MKFKPNTVYCGEALQVLQTFPDDCVDCILTSPPYYNLRDYESEPLQIGLESSPADYVARLRTVFAECRRVLKPAGTLWLNIGDSYAGSGKGPNSEKPSKQATNVGTLREIRTGTMPGLKPKDQIGVPWRLAFALQDDGWWLRKDIIWGKPNAMPESMDDRPTSAHEYLFLMSISGTTKLWRHKDSRDWSQVKPEPDFRWVHKRTGDRVDDDPNDSACYRKINLWEGFDYFYDKDSIKSTLAESSVDRLSQNVQAQIGSTRGNGGTREDRPVKALVERSGKQRGHSRTHAGFNERWDHMSTEEQSANGANARSVWMIPTIGFKQAHFATFPPELARRCILAGCPEGGILLDPFCGSGTALMVAEQLGRRWVGIDLSQKYARMSRDRTRQRGIFSGDDE